MERKADDGNSRQGFDPLFLLVSVCQLHSNPPCAHGTMYVLCSVFTVYSVTTILWIFDLVSLYNHSGLFKRNASTTLRKLRRCHWQRLDLSLQSQASWVNVSYWMHVTPSTLPVTWAEAVSKVRPAAHILALVTHSKFQKTWHDCSEKPGHRNPPTIHGRCRQSMNREDNDRASTQFVYYIEPRWLTWNKRSVYLTKCTAVTRQQGNSDVSEFGNFEHFGPIWSKLIFSGRKRRPRNLTINVHQPSPRLDRTQLDTSHSNRLHALQLQQQGLTFKDNEAPHGYKLRAPGKSPMFIVFYNIFCVTVVSPNKELLVWASVLTAVYNGDYSSTDMIHRLPLLVFRI